MSFRSIVVLVVAIFGAASALSMVPNAKVPVYNTRPVIGILTQPSNDLSSYGPNYIAASYVKYLESAGARVVAVHWDWPKTKLQSVLKQLNGLLFTGGGADTSGTPFYRAAESLFLMIQQMNDNGDYFPLWGTCQGFELLLMIAASDYSILECDYDAHNLTLPLTFTADAAKTKLIGNAPLQVQHILQTLPVTMNNHMCGVGPAEFNGNAKLKSFFKLASTNVDRKNNSFVSTIEAYKYPIFGVQWHPEKPMFEWTTTEGINHTLQSIEANTYTSMFFVEECRQNAHVLTDDSLLIYHNTPTYTGAVSSDFMQCYFFQ